MRAVFQDHGCSACSAKAMVEDLGIDLLDKLHFLKDGDAKTLRKNVKCNKILSKAQILLDFRLLGDTGWKMSFP